MKDKPGQSPTTPEPDQAVGKETAEESLAVLQDFLARMGHELRTPIHAIVGFLDLAEDNRKEEGGEVGDYLRNARVSALTLLDLINNLLDLARMERGELGLDSVAFRLDELLDEVTRTLSPQAQMKGLELEYLIDPLVSGPCLGDPVRLKQVLFNLAGNAVKFTGRGHVLLKADRPENGAPGDVRFTVTDSGEGIPDEMRERIFQSYVRLKLAGADDTPGAGLGLAISNQLVAAMGGRIDLHSEVGKGSEFSFTVNLPPAEEVAHEPAEVQGPSLEGSSILLVHPHGFGRSVYGEKLTLRGAVVTTASSFAEGETRLREAEASGTPHRLVLVDMACGIAEASAFARTLRETAGRFQPDLVFMVPMGRFPDEDRLSRAGFTGILAKPVNPEEMRRYLGSLIARQTASGAPMGNHGVGRERFRAQPGVKGNILVVEDNAVSQKLLQAFLGKQGFRVTVASNGRQGVEAFEKSAFDLVLMDLQMPEMDGLTATRRIREFEKGKDIPIIAMTAATLKGDRERCLEAGMSDFSPKPILPNVLLKLIHSWLERTGGKRGAGGFLSGGMQTLPDLDLDHLESVFRYVNPESRVKFDGFVAAFVQDLTTLLAELVGAHDTAGIGGPQADASLQVLRKVRSLAEGFGAPRLAALAHHLITEQAGLSRQAWKEGMDSFRREAETLVQRLRQPLFPD